MALFQHARKDATQGSERGRSVLRVEAERLEENENIIFIRSTSSIEDRVVGRTDAYLIGRDSVRATFHRDVEVPSRDTALLAYELFDRYGCFKEELQHHPVKRGSGIWGQELDHGDLLIFEVITVEQEYQYQGIGTSMAIATWEKASELSRKLEYAFAWSDTPREIENACGVLSRRERLAIFETNRSIAVRFYRSLGFRRVADSHFFCVAKDGNHPSHTVSAEDDFDPPVYPSWHLDDDDEQEEEKQGAASPDPVFSPSFQLNADPVEDDWTLLTLKKRLPLHYALIKFPDVACTPLLQTYPVDDPIWEAVTRSGNTPLHLAAALSKPECIALILATPAGTRLMEARNHLGYTPAEFLQARLEYARVRREEGDRFIAVSDSFRGYDAKSVLCLLRLRGLTNPTWEQVARVQYGCTCDGCLGGYISPRMSSVLQFQGNVVSVGLNEAIDNPEVLDIIGERGKYLRQNVLGDLSISKAMRAGFADTFRNIARTLRLEKTPNEPTVRSVASEHSEWPADSKIYFERGGTASAAMSEIIDLCQEKDDLVGSGEFSQNRFGALPRCRNDREFGFVRLLLTGVERQQ
jgi:GNAT superfamily N-acetyltransferase